MEGIVLEASVTASATAEYTSLIIAITALLTGGGISAFRNFRKAPVEREAISVRTLRSVIEELRSELTRISEENEELRESNRTLSSSVESLRARLAEQAG